VIICCVLGKVESIKGTKLQIKEHNGDLLDIIVSLDLEDELTLGEDVVVLGSIEKGIIYAEQINPRRFLNPLNENKLMEISGAYSNIPLLNSPFDDQYKSKQQTIEQNEN
jgi:hypothetical protein